MMLTVEKLERMGFRAESDIGGRVRRGWFAKANVRVIVADSCVEVYAFDGASMAVCEWSARFDASTPEHVIAAAVFAAVEGG